MQFPKGDGFWFII